MKKKELNETKKKEISELRNIINKKRLELKMAHVNILDGKEKNLKLAKNLRKDIAQLLTFISEKEIFDKDKLKK